VVEESNMAAVFITYQANDIFQYIPGDSSSLVNIENLDDLVNNEGALAIYTDIAISTSEITQFFPTFDDIIHFLHFGKGLGNITVNGILFSDCTHGIPGLTPFYQAFQSMRGKKVAVSMGGISFYANVTTSNCTISGEPDTMAQWQVSMQIVEDSMGAPATS
jgi:hypothetical protein